MYNGISRSFVLGYLMGLAGLPVKTALGAALPPAADREKPAMFYYNGMGPFPGLPEGYENFPCATIGKLDDAISLHLSDVPFFARVNASGTYNLANLYKDIGVKFHMFRLLQNGIWDDYGVDILGINRVLFGGLTDSWANYDMPDQNGNIYIRKTAPIPVIGGSKNPIAPSVFLAGLRFGILSRHSRALPELPDGVLISSDGYILTDYNGVYLIAAVDAEPDEPDEPGEVATMYLYGTPSESGNIGLRVGDTVTYYDGAVATAYPEWDSVPYVAIVKTDRYDCVADYSSCPIILAYEGTLHLAASGTNRMYNHDVFKDGVWLVREPKENTLTNWGEPAGYPSDHEKILWSNHDIKNSSETEVMFAKSPDPIPIYNGIVEYINGIPIYE